MTNTKRSKKTKTKNQRRNWNMIHTTTIVQEVVLMDRKDARKNMMNTIEIKAAPIERNFLGIPEAIRAIDIKQNVAQINHMSRRNERKSTTNPIATEAPIELNKAVAQGAGLKIDIKQKIVMIDRIARISGRKNMTVMRMIVVEALNKTNSADIQEADPEIDIHPRIVKIKLLINMIGSMTHLQVIVSIRSDVGNRLQIPAQAIRMTPEMLKNINTKVKSRRKNTRKSQRNETTENNLGEKKTLFQ